jgi:hypothetical protein
MSKPSDPAPQRQPFDLRKFLLNAKVITAEIAGTVESAALRIAATVLLLLALFRLLKGELHL